MIRHAAPLFMSSSVGALAVAMVQAPFGTLLVIAPVGASQLELSLPPAEVGAVAMSAVAALAQKEQALATAAPLLEQARWGGCRRGLLEGAP